MMDFSNFGTVDNANSTKATVKKRKKPIIPPTRIVEEQPTTRPTIKSNNIDYSMYAKIFCGCDTCGTETIHYITETKVNCMYCSSSYSFNLQTKGVDSKSHNKDLIFI